MLCEGDKVTVPSPDGPARILATFLAPVDPDEIPPGSPDQAWVRFDEGEHEGTAGKYPHAEIRADEAHWNGYAPIKDLPDVAETLASSELGALDRIWREQRDRLEELDEMRRFRERLIREWSIETGVVERVYEIDRGVTELLIERGLEESLLSGATDRDPATVAAILHDHQASIEGVFDFVAGKRPLTCGYVRELHALLTRNQATARGRDPTGRETEIPLRRGEWKSFPNNPTRPDGTTHVYCPPEQVQGEMERLLSRHAQHADDHRVPPETQAAWLHHRFTQIHPFQDGNGRVARTLASLVFIRAGWFPLSIHRDQKVEYIDALEAADRGDLAPLIRLFARIARDALIRAMTVADQSERDLGGLEQLVAAARDRLIVRGAEVNGQALDRARSIAETLNEASAHELERTRAVLQEGIASELPDLAITVESAPFGDSKRTNWYRATQVRFARGELYYFANVDAYTSWARLRLSRFDTATRHDLVVCLHGMGQTFRGLIAAVCFLQQFSSTEEKKRMEFVSEQLVQPELFQLNYGESPDQANQRFIDWLGDCIRIGLAQWIADLGG